MANVRWTIDPTHSEVQFKVKHLMITTVTGYFQHFNAEAETEDEEFKNPKRVVFTADVNSINTNNEQRDTHLRSPDFFDVATHKDLRFEATDYEKVGDDEFKVHGDLTIRGTTKPITINADFGGIVVDPYGQTKAGFTITGKIKRKDFGLTWDAVTEAGSVVVSDDIKINAEVQLVKQE